MFLSVRDVSKFFHKIRMKCLTNFTSRLNSMISEFHKVKRSLEKEFSRIDDIDSLPTRYKMHYFGKVINDNEH